MGRELTKQWLSELYEQAYHPSQPKPPIEQWSTEEFSKVPGFKYEKAVNFYPYIYQRRYADFPDEGYAFMENEMQNAHPSFGYIVLAQIMAGERHKIAITTNFDNLISDALTIYTSTLPLVCGHESLANYLKPDIRRPVIAKLHRDLLLAPKSNPDEISKLHQNWEGPLQDIFKTYTPIVIGFGDTGGSGGSLVRFLEHLPAIPGGIYWCYREKKQGAPPADDIDSLVAHHNGRLVPIPGFDELMHNLWHCLSLGSLHDDLKERHGHRIVKGYTRDLTRLAEAIISQAKTVDTETAKTACRHAEAALLALTEKESQKAVRNHNMHLVNLAELVIDAAPGTSSEKAKAACDHVKLALDLITGDTQ
jgi:hypothetical protein